MKNMTIAIVMASAVAAGSLAQAEPRSYGDLSFNQENSAAPAQISASEAGHRITEYRPYHLRSSAAAVDTEIAAFVEVNEKETTRAAVRMDRIPR